MTNTIDAFAQRVSVIKINAQIRIGCQTDNYIKNKHELAMALMYFNKVGDGKK